MLMEHGDYILPENVPANEFMNLEGEKISTSRNWAVWLHEYLKDFPDMQDEFLRAGRVFWIYSIRWFTGKNSLLI